MEADKQEILKLADEMAAAATNFRGQGYEIFIETRDRFKEFLEQLSTKYIEK